MTMIADRRCVILFARVPEKGMVKSRLALHMDEDLALRLYENMVLDTLDMLRSGHFPFRIFFTPAYARDTMTKWLGHRHHYVPQTGEDLGERMEAAFASVFSGGADETLLIGCDIPGLTGEVMSDAFLSLQTNDAVIGPAADGGYYLVGFRKKSFQPAVFHGVTWSANSVLHETLDKMRDASLRVHILPELTDMDTVGDLKTFFGQGKHPVSGPSKTRSFLERHCADILE
jgi:hypothetical protein